MFLTCGSASFVLRPNMGMAGAVIGLAACSAAVSLYYLHSRKQTDFYESLPIKRATLFRLVVQNSLFIFADSACCRRSNRICHCAATDFWRRMGNSQFWPLVFVNFCSNMADDGSGNDYDREYYRGILGFGVFASYFPIVLYNSFPIICRLLFFSTYSGNTADNVYNNITNYLSPVWVGLPGDGRYQ